MSFDGQRVVIVGGSAGIGEATAGAFAADGAHVIIRCVSSTPPTARP
jgi:NAD(P)-dependent dehydrogenase (short-subunit alcohol dehydrogenase family)